MSVQRPLCSRAIARVGSSLPLLQQSHKNVAFLFFLLSGQTLLLTAILGETLDESSSNSTGGGIAFSTAWEAQICLHTCLMLSRRNKIPQTLLVSGFWAMQLFSLWMGIILLHVYKKARRLKELSWPKRLPLTAFKVSLRHLQGWHSRTVQQLKNSILTGSGGGGGGGSLMTWNIETMGEI